ncbi:unnamed protein product, partial [Sphenostylis stenocarpa]
TSELYLRCTLAPIFSLIRNTLLVPNLSRNYPSHLHFVSPNPTSPSNLKSHLMQITVNHHRT